MEPLRYKPAAFWRLDDTIPFQDYSGYSASGTASSAPSTGIALSSEAVYSVAFTNAIQGQFTSPVFRAGDEQRDFSLEATFFSEQKTADTLSALAYRENLVRNPTLETNTSDWAAATGATIAQSATQALFGTKSLAVTTTGTNGDGTYVNIPTGYLVPGQTYTWSFYGYLPAGTPRMAAVIRFQDAAGNNTGTDLVTDYTTPVTGAWTRFTVTGVAPTGTVKAIALARIFATHTAMTYYVDGALFEASSTPNSYIDGSLPGYEWSGTANVSVSRTRRDIGRVNLSTNPSSETSAMTTEGGGTGTNTVSTTQKMFGSQSTKFVWGGTGSRGLSLVQGLFTVKPSTTYTISAYVFVESGVIPQFIVTDAGYGNSQNFSTISGTGSWQRISKTFTTAANQNAIHSYGLIAAAGTYYVDGVLVEETGTLNSYFDGSYSGTTWAGTANASVSYMYATALDQSILSHTGKYDGLVVNGTKISFVTKYTNGTEARATYDYQIGQKIHAVGVHSLSKNSLFVNGELVAEVDISDTQQTATFDAPSNVLYSGQTTGGGTVLMNNVGLYGRALLTEEVRRIYAANNRKALASVPKAFGGEDVLVSTAVRPAFLSTGWFTTDDWKTAVMTNVVAEDGRLIPTMDLGLTMAGTWQDSVDLYTGETPVAINSIAMFWYGENVKVEASVDGTTWETVTRGVNLTSIPTGFDPTGKQLYVKVTFLGGQSYAYLDSLMVRGYTSSTATPPNHRTITYTNPVVTLDEKTPGDLRDDWGVKILGGTLSISAEPASNESPMAVRTVEVWMKRLGTETATFSSNLSTATNFYSNGIVGSGYPTGEWVVRHFVNTGADITGAITFSGNVQIGKVVIYPTALTATQIAQIVANYTGVTKTTQDGSGVIAIAESASPTTIYAHDWATVSA